MEERLVVRPDKNEFLLYAMLSSQRLIGGHPDIHFLRRKTLDHFQGCPKLGLKERCYRHHSKPGGYVLTLNEAPDLTEKQGLDLDSQMKREIKSGKRVLPYLKRFYKTTDFEDFYQSILPRYQEECEFLQGIFERENLIDILDEAWEAENLFQIEAIPMPLESGGIGPSIGNTCYPVFGPPFNYRSLYLVAHESSHPIAKRTIRHPLNDEIDKRAHLLKQAQKHPNYPKEYSYWRTCFEEHFIRAMQNGFIDPIFFKEEGFKVKGALEMEEQRCGMVFIKDFYDEIRKHKEKPKRTLADVALRILERLDEKYGRKK